MQMVNMSFREAITTALREEMERDPSVILLGEDVGRHGGARGVTKGLWQTFGPTRVIDTPISEQAISGACCGAALGGLRPVAECFIGDIIMFMADSLVTSSARMHFATGGELNVPLVIRGADASRPDGGPHQDTFANWFANVPGLKVVIPSTPRDAKGLMISAIRDDNPVIFMEPIRLYDTVGPVPVGEFTIPIGKAEVRAEGSDVTIATIGGCVALAAEAKEDWDKRGVSIEVLDLRSLRPLDTESIHASVKKTGRLIVVHEGWTHYGIGAEVIATASEMPGINWRATPQRVGTLETHLPASIILSRAVLPNRERLDAAIERAMAKPD